MTHLLRLALGTALLAAALPATALPATAKAPSMPDPTELFHFEGTEPFWGGEVRGGSMKLDWPDNERGVRIQVVRRQVGRSIVYTGRLANHPHFLPRGSFTMTVIREKCSDGMSDRIFPFDVTIVAGSSRAVGCGWTARHPYREDPAG